MTRRLLALALAAGYTTLYMAANTLIAPAQRSVGPPPASLPTEDVEITSDSGTTLRGWYIEGAPGQESALLLHGIRADRRSMLGRARFLHELGYAALLIGPQALGESEGTHITVGVRESGDARVALRYLRQAIRNRPRIRGGAVAAWLEPLPKWELGRQLSQDADEVRPVDGIGRVTAAVMITAGELDRRTTLAQ